MRNIKTKEKGEFMNSENLNKENQKNELDKPRKKNIFFRMIEEIKNIFAKDPEEIKDKESQFLNDKLNFDFKSNEVNHQQNNKKEEKKDININIDPSQDVQESEIIKRRSKHLVIDSLNDRLELEDLSYYDLKILYNELLRNKKLEG